MKLTLDEPEPGLTVVKLLHTDIPEEDRLVWLLVLTSSGSSSSFVAAGLLICLCGSVLQIWERDCGGEHRERMEGSHIP